ncbi:MAG: hypothetical protein Ct9H90mP13_12800 [Pseudomonadota bacterium]|nr:MAG: hypothetical protein Ct9H90mP13_12800 [Pseudomonadota bacterium]
MMLLFDIQTGIPEGILIDDANLQTSESNAGANFQRSTLKSRY